MNANEEQIKKLIENWAEAISSGNRVAILAHHSEQFHMFDFPEPIIRGLKDYDRQWDFFYAAPRGQISFVPRDLEVVANDYVGFAHCLIHCNGTSAGPLELRLTVGLRKINGSWAVLHEHHSVPTIEERFIGPNVGQEEKEGT